MTGAADVWSRLGMAGAMAFAVYLLSQLTVRPEAEPASITAAISHEPAPMQPVSINYAPPYNALDPLTPMDETADAVLFDPQDNYWGLPRSEGYELTAAYCSACHSLRIVMQQKQSREGWLYLLGWMEDQGMAKPAPEDHAALLDYLTREFGE